MTARATPTTVSPPPGGSHRHRFAKCVIGSTSRTTIASHIAANARQTWPTVAAEITVTSDAGATDSGRVIRCWGVLVDTFERVDLDVTLNASGIGTIPLSAGWLDVNRMRDVTFGQDEPSAGTVSAAAGANVLCEITPDRGSSLSSREYVAAGFVGYVQSVDADFDARLDDLAIWAKFDGQPWHALTDNIAGGGSNAGRAVGRDYSSNTSWGIRCDGPCRMAARGKANTGTLTISFEFNLLTVPRTVAAQ